MRLRPRTGFETWSVNSIHNSPHDPVTLDIQFGDSLQAVWLARLGGTGGKLYNSTGMGRTHLGAATAELEGSWCWRPWTQGWGERAHREEDTASAGGGRGWDEPCPQQDAAGWTLKSPDS